MSRAIEKPRTSVTRDPVLCPIHVCFWSVGQYYPVQGHVWYLGVLQELEPHESFMLYESLHPDMRMINVFPCVYVFVRARKCERPCVCS